MCRAGAKAGLSEPMLARRSGNDQQIKATPGITGWYYPSVHSDDAVRHLDVGSPYPGGGEAPKGLAVRQLRRYASWVQAVQALSPKSDIRCLILRNLEFEQSEPTRHMKITVKENTAAYCSNAVREANVYR